MTRPVVLVTGSAGRIGGLLAGRLENRFRLIGFDRRPGVLSGTVADLRDTAALSRACDGADAIVHLAGASRVDASWPEVIASNIAGTVAVFEAAREKGVGRVVFASSNHVTGGFECEHAPGLYSLDDARVLADNEGIRPDSPYGVSKAFGEALGRLAFERDGVRVVCLRMGSVLDPDDPWEAAVAQGGGREAVLDRFQRYRATWLSHGDCAGLVAASLEADVGYAVVYGVSANPRRFWDLEAGRRLLGWWPQDAAPIDPPGTPVA